MRAVPFLPCEHVLVACSTSFFASQHFWGMGEHFAEHPILGQKSNYLFRSLLWLISFAKFTKISHYWTTTDFNLVIVHRKRTDVEDF